MIDFSRNLRENEACYADASWQREGESGAVGRKATLTPPSPLSDTGGSATGRGGSCLEVLPVDQIDDDLTKGVLLRWSALGDQKG